MNIEQARGSVGKSVLCFNPVLSDKVLWIKEVHENACSGKWFYHAVIQDSTGKTYSVGLDEIDFLPEQEDKQVVNSIIGNLSVKIDADEVKQMLENVGLKKEIAFSLIQQGQIVDDGFKKQVDIVFDAITS